jgi:hypothetical protein
LSKPGESRSINRVEGGKGRKEVGQGMRNRLSSFFYHCTMETKAQNQYGKGRRFYLQVLLEIENFPCLGYLALHEAMSEN